MTFFRIGLLVLATAAIAGCASPQPRVVQIRSREQTSPSQLIQMFGPATKHYRVPGHPNYEVIAFHPLFQNWHKRVFLYKDGRYFDQASGEFPITIRAQANGEVSIVKTGPSADPPIGAPRPRGGY